MNQIADAAPKGSKLNPYDCTVDEEGIAHWEFPREQFKGLTETQLDEMEAVWHAHPEWQGQDDGQPNWDELFDAIGA